MKLHDLLIERIDLSKPTMIDFKGHQWLPVSGELAGQGIQARVYKTGSGVVTKVAVLDDELGLRDPAVKFLDIILQHQDNPFFPRIYHARVYRDKEGILNPILLVQMEKLMSMTDPKIEDAAAGLLDQLGIGTSELSPKFKEYVKRSEWSKPTKRIMTKTSALNNKLMSASMKGDTKAIARLGSRSKNPQFREAIKLLAPTMAKEGSDLHHGNWMVRLTAAGPQLVIIDPFAPSTDANIQ